METTTTLRLLPLPPSPPLPPPSPPPPWLTHTHTPFPFSRNKSPYLPPLHIHTPTSFALTFAQISSSSRFRLYATRGNFQRRRRRKSDRKSKQRRWWSDDFEDEDDDGVFEEKRRSGTLSQVVDSLWIFKVLKSYGWFSPAILLSLLLATGPKAFLMAFSIPLGVSLVILGFEKLSEWLGVKPRPRRRRKGRSLFSIGYDFLMGEDDEIQQVKRKWKKDYQSWVARNRSSVHKGSSGGRGSGSPSRFGGWEWDELVREEEVERAQSSPRKIGRPEKPGWEAQMNRSRE